MAVVEGRDRGLVFTSLEAGTVSGMEKELDQCVLH